MPLRAAGGHETPPEEGPASLPEPAGPSLPELLRAASRTFAIGIELLGPPLRDEVRIAYLLLRVSDYLEDNREMEAGEKVRLLLWWSEVLAGRAALEAHAAELAAAADPTPDARVARHVGTVVEGLERLEERPRGIVTRHVGDSTRGMARWVERGPDFETEADLDDYMHEVAGRVGHLLTDLFSLRSPGVARRHEEMMELGREFGLALQTVNVIRGLHEDRERGWVYVPREFVPAGTEPARIFRPEERDAAVAVLDRLVEKAERHFRGAREYVRRIPRRHHRIRLFCLLPLFFGVRTLAVSRSNPDVFDRETKISRAEVRRIVRLSIALGFSNRWMEWYCRRLSAE